ncbi:helix-turn-helix domain-containing protein [Vibrio parahaemolyticus]|nr:helix-turn-helix domain-containing protein [Vibrio parahaemolyticus]
MDLLRINDACHVTGLSRKTLYRYMDKGALKYQEIDGKRYIALSDLKGIKRPPKKRNESRSDHDTSSEMIELKNEIITLKNSILYLNEHIKEINDMLRTYVSKDESKKPIDTKKTPLKKENISGDNERRAEEAKKRVFSALDKLLESDSIPLYRGKISPSGVQKETGIDRGTISKYLPEWAEKKNYSI